MSSAREKILGKLREAQKPFHDAPPRPRQYLPVTSIADQSPEGLLERFTSELEKLNGEVFVVDGDEATRDCVLSLLEEHNTRRIAAWHFKHIPVAKLYTAVKEAGYTIDYPNIRLEDRTEREIELARLETAEVGLTGVEAAAASTGTLVVSTGPGKSRIPSLLVPTHIAIVSIDQLVPRIEDWLAQVREANNAILQDSANITFITGPSRTADIEKQLVLGVHGPKRLQVVVKR